MWTEENIRRAIMMRRGGYSAQKIADAIGATRNAVIGKMYRLNEPAVGRFFNKKPRPRDLMNHWSVERLTETWGERKARLARERSA